MSEKFKPGDVVRLKAGGPQMVVESWIDIRQAFKCTWFAGAKHNSKEFQAVALEKYEESPK